MSRTAFASGESRARADSHLCLPKTETRRRFSRSPTQLLTQGPRCLRRSRAERENSTLVKGSPIAPSACPVVGLIRAAHDWSRSERSATTLAVTATELLRRIEADAGLQRVLRVAEAHEDGDPGHDLSHSLRVALWTQRLGGDAIDPREAIAAALLHDAVNVPKNSPERASASVLSAQLATEVLPGAGFFADAIVRIGQAIEDHSYSRGAVPRSPLGCALQDADRLEAMGALGVLRMATCGARLGARYLDLHDPWARQRPLDDRRFSVDHFFVKLLQLEKTLRTEAGRAEARRRSAFMRDFLRELGKEIGESLEEESPVRDEPARVE